MSNLATDTVPHIVIGPEEDGRSTRVDLMLDDKSVSRLWLTPFTLHIGEALVRMDGVGGVGTEEEHRHKGYSRRVLEAAVEHMKQGDAALSMLYGIRDFYPKLGFATAGPDHLVLLTDLERDSSLPAGWSVRPFTAEDLSAIQALYAQGTVRTTGAAIRASDSSIWEHLLETTTDPTKDACRVVLGPDGSVRGYLWRARWCWYVEHTLETNCKEALVVGEVMADSPAAADAVLAACRLWAREEASTQKIKEVVLAFPPQGSLAAAAMRQDARFIRNYGACGGSMTRVLDVKRLLESLRPELLARLRAAHSNFTGSLVFQTDMGATALQMDPQQITLSDEPSGGETLTVSLPQFELGRLALGAFPPNDLLARLSDPPNEATSQLLEILFPLRYPHMHLPDRY